MSRERESIHSSGEKRIAGSLLTSRLARVVLPEPGRPQTMINLGPLADFSIGHYPTAIFGRGETIDYGRRIATGGIERWDGPSSLFRWICVDSDCWEMYLT